MFITFLQYFTVESDISHVEWTTAARFYIIPSGSQANGHSTLYAECSNNHSSLFHKSMPVKCVNVHSTLSAECSKHSVHCYDVLLNKSCTSFCKILNNIIEITPPGL